MNICISVYKAVGGSTGSAKLRMTNEQNNNLEEIDSNYTRYINNFLKNN